MIDRARIQQATRRTLQSVGWFWRVGIVRLRFLMILGAAFLITAQWSAIRDVAERVAKRISGRASAPQVVSADTEYFCPMDPGVISDWPSKCPICNMALVRRKRGDSAPLPDGVIARMQFSPYRLQLGGIRTTPVVYLPITRNVEGPARLVPDLKSQIDVELFESDLHDIAAGQAVTIRPSAGAAFKGVVRSVEPSRQGLGLVRVDVDDPNQRFARTGGFTARIEIPAASLSPFRERATEPPPLLPKEPRRAYVCMEHSDSVSEGPGRCSIDDIARHTMPLAANQRLRWWCPMHPQVVADRPGAECRECGGMKLLPRIIDYPPAGKVLAIPESAVIDTGSRSVVFVERMPGMFDGVEVVLGPRCGDAFPVIAGLEPGRKVVTSGAFLIDAETRLNPSAASGYFGASKRETGPAPSSDSSDDKLSPTDRTLVLAQKFCPVTGKPLGSMGTPQAVTVEGRRVFVCCAGCTPALEANSKKYLAKLPKSPATSRPVP